MSAAVVMPADDRFAVAKAAFDAGRYADARDGYTALVAADPRDHAAHCNLAQCYKRLGDWPRAAAHFRSGFELRRLGTPSRSVALSAFQVEHLAEQLAWLHSIGRADGYGGAMAAELARMARLLRDCYGAHRTGRLPLAFDAGVMALVDGCAHLPAIEVPASTFNTAPTITTIPLERSGDAIHILDDVLCPAALAALRRWLSEATIWYDARPARGYLGAHLHDGLLNPLMLRLLGDARRCVAGLVGDVRIVQAWAFKYAPIAPGIDLHADQASWNLNIWPTPTVANLDPASGGMTIAKFRAPPDWTFQAYNASPDRLRAMLAEQAVAEVTIPYRGNRAVLFPSRYLHRTDAVRFAPAYDLRRINLTFMADAA